MLFTMGIDWRLDGGGGGHREDDTPWRGSTVVHDSRYGFYTHWGLTLWLLHASRTDLLRTSPSLDREMAPPMGRRCGFVNQPMGGRPSLCTSLPLFLYISSCLCSWLYSWLFDISWFWFPSYLALETVLFLNEYTWRFNIGCLFLLLPLTLGPVSISWIKPSFVIISALIHKLSIWLLYHGSLIDKPFWVYISELWD